MTDNPVALVAMLAPLRVGQVVTLRWRGARGGVPAYLDRTPAVVLGITRRWLVVGTEQGARRVAPGNVEQ